ADPRRLRTRARSVAFTPASHARYTRDTLDPPTGYDRLMVIAESSITALYLFDVAEEADLAAVPRLLQAQASPARLAPKPFTPAYVQYQNPPIVLDGEALQLPGLSP